MNASAKRRGEFMWRAKRSAESVRALVSELARSIGIANSILHRHHRRLSPAIITAIAAFGLLVVVVGVYVFRSDAKRRSREHTRKPWDKK